MASDDIACFGLTSLPFMLGTNPKFCRRRPSMQDASTVHMNGSFSEGEKTD